MQYTELARDDHFIYVLEPVTPKQATPSSMPFMFSLSNKAFEYWCPLQACDSCIFNDCGDLTKIAHDFPHLTTSYPELFL